MVNVKRGGLGKIPHDRTFYISTDGFVREGFMDMMKERILAVLKAQIQKIEFSHSTVSLMILKKLIIKICGKKPILCCTHH